MIHILGDGPYAREVTGQIVQFGAEIEYVSQGQDEHTFPTKIVLGIASPSVKRFVMEEFYGELEQDVFISVVHRTALIQGSHWDYRIGNSIQYFKCVNVGPYTTIGLNVSIGDFVSICANVTIGHDVKIGKYSTIAPGVVISGYVSIGEGVFIGAGAVIKDRIAIGDNVTIGCGAVVVEDVRSNHVVVGNPAKFLKLNQ